MPRHTATSGRLEGFVSAPGLMKVLGCSRSAVYRLIEVLERPVEVTAENGHRLEVLAVPELGGIKWPKCDWLFKQEVAAQFRVQILQRAREIENAD